MMFCDWQIFWHEHYQREQVGEYDLHLAVMESCVVKLQSTMFSNFIPGIRKASEAMAKAFENVHKELAKPSPLWAAMKNSAGK